MAIPYFTYPFPSNINVLQPFTKLKTAWACKAFACCPYDLANTLVMCLFSLVRIFSYIFFKKLIPVGVHSLPGEQTGQGGIAIMMWKFVKLLPMDSWLWVIIMKWETDISHNTWHNAISEPVQIQLGLPIIPTVWQYEIWDLKIHDFMEIKRLDKKMKVSLLTPSLGPWKMKKLFPNS